MTPFWLYVLGTVLDAVLTYHGLVFHGQREGNLFATWVFSRLGLVPGMLLLKSQAIAGAYWVSTTRYRSLVCWMASFQWLLAVAPWLVFFCIGG